MQEITETQQTVGMVYRITSNQRDGCYIGSTIQPLHKRFSERKSDDKRYLNGYMNYVYCFEVVQHEDAKIELVHEGVFDTKRDLEKLEGQFIENGPDTTKNKGSCNNNCREHMQQLRQKPGEEVRRSKSILQQIPKYETCIHE
jgi:hypothetical protein